MCKYTTNSESLTCKRMQMVGAVQGCPPSRPRQNVDGDVVTYRQASKCALGRE